MEARNVKPGIPVFLWNTVRKNKGFEHVETEVVSEPFKQKGKIVCKVECKTTPVPVSHLQPIAG